MVRASLWVFVVLGIARPAIGQAPADSTALRVTFGGFVDTYYAYDTGRPRLFDRAFTTQPARHNEANVNLAFIEAKLDGARVRGRIALQAGTSVESNYSGEPNTGTVSGPTLSRHIQEATVGVRVAPRVWIDGGIYLSHIGAESWASRDNLTYTRSLMADYSPYYQAGAKATWSGSKVTAQINLVNGWQIISENNQDKSVGVRIDYAPSSKVTMSVYNLIGNEMPDTLAGRTRAYEGATIRFAPSSKATVVAAFDFGWQAGPAGLSGSTWYGTALFGRVQLSEQVAVTARLERYNDPDQVIIATSTTHGFRVNGGSFGVDVAPYRGVVWRNEIRGLHGNSPLFPDRNSATGRSNTNAFIVTSLGLSF